MERHLEHGQSGRRQDETLVEGVLCQDEAGGASAEVGLVDLTQSLRV